MKTFHSLVPSAKMRLALTIALGVFVALLIFHAGVAFGYHRALERDHMRFGHGFEPRFFQGNVELPPGFIPNSHGAVGMVTAMNGNILTVETRDGETQSVLIASSTLIRSAMGSTTPLTVGSVIVVLGDPNSEGGIDARIINVLPPPPHP